MDVVDEGPVGENPFDISHQTPSVTGTPLQIISPERLNQRIPASPSLPLPLKFEQRASRHQHRLSDASDVKARVAYLNSINGSPTRSPSPSKPYHHASSHAAIQRAIVGREEAETALNAMIAQLESAKARERLVAERVESLMEQLQEARSRQRHERQVYEKEMKMAKKGEYKAELAVIKLQEELKEVKHELEGYRARADHDKSEKEKARQESFERAYVVAGMTEELQTLKDQLQIVEQERDHAVATAASKMPLDEKTKQPDVADKATGTEDLNVQVGRETEHMEISPSQPLSLTFLEMEMDGIEPTLEQKYALLQEQIKSLVRDRREDQELIHFMNLQCQFKACPCRKAEEKGVRFVHDYEYDRKMQAQNPKKRKLEPPIARWPTQTPKWWAAMVEWKKFRATVPSDNVQQGSQYLPDNMELDGKEANLVAPTDAPLPPAEIDLDHSRESLQISEASEAAQIPLPVSGEDTAQLEDFTQVMVEPMPVSQKLDPTGPASGHRMPTENLPHLSQSHSNISLSEDLFNLSPPKRVPPRPSTAMGIVSVDSPVRLVPHSPQPRTIDNELPQTVSQPQTMRVALNDTSRDQQPKSHRSRSRPNVRTQSRGRSPISQASESRPTSALEVASPASSTVFPITPIPKHPRGALVHETAVEGLAQRQHQPQAYSGLQSETTTTTTTTIPLRGEDDCFEFSHSQPLMTSVPANSAVFLHDAHNVPGTPITREAALAQIRARRDRARSVNMRKAEQDGHPDGERRGMKTPGSAARRGVKIDLGHRLGLAQKERGREVSQASAPGRI